MNTRRVAILGGVRIPFCRQNTAYADVGNLGMSEVKFPAPLFEGDTVSVTTEVAAKRESLRSEIERAERRLANEKFVERAPTDVVEAERRKLGEYREALRRLGE